MQRAFCEEVIEMGKGRYLAQLNNYPAKESRASAACTYIVLYGPI